MFQSSPQRLFRPVSALAHFKIHHQLPLNPRESKQLLNLLTTSFRRQLDQEHGDPFTERESGGQSRTHDSNNSLSDAQKSSVSTRGSRRPTDKHVHSILTNPLFNYGSGKNNVRDGQRDPMDIFDEAYAKGFMKMEYAEACLRAKKRSITESSALSVRGGMKESGAGLKVLQWLSSSGVIKDAMLPANQAFRMLLIEFLVAGDLHEVVWTWIEEAFCQLPSNEARWSTSQSLVVLSRHLLLSLVKTQTMLDSISLDTAYASLIRARKILDEWYTTGNVRTIISPAGCFLSYQSSVNSSSHLPSSGASYDLFLESIPAFTKYENMHMAHLRLHHPSRPDAGPALKYLTSIRREKWIYEFSDRSPNSIDAPQRIKGWRVIALGLDAAKFLLEKDRYPDAKWVMDFLQSKFPNELGLSARHKQDLEQARAEAASLELLQSLNMA